MILARIDQQVKSDHSSLSKQYCNIKRISMIKVHFSNIRIWFLARIDQQAETYHCRLSKQDIIKKQKRKNKQQNKKQQQQQQHQQQQQQQQQQQLRPCFSWQSI